MERGARPAKARVTARPVVSRKSQTVDNSPDQQVEQRLTEALEQQTATSEILRVISQSQLDVQPVFDTIAAAALKLSSAWSVNVLTFDGELIQIAALAIRNPEEVDAVRSM